MTGNLSCGSVNYGNTYMNNVPHSNQNKGSFNDFVNKISSTIPDKTTTIEEKMRAINVKQAIMSHPECPPESKPIIQSEIMTIQNEIEQIKNMEKGNNAVPQFNSINTGSNQGNRFNVLA